MNYPAMMDCSWCGGLGRDGWAGETPIPCGNSQCREGKVPRVLTEEELEQLCDARFTGVVGRPDRNNWLMLDVLREVGLLAPEGESDGSAS